MPEERRKLKKERQGDVGRRSARHRIDQEMSAELLYLLNHPVRRQILRSLNGDGSSRSPSELTKVVVATLSNLSYHMGVLKGRKAIRQTSVRPVRGTEERFFASTVSGNKLVAEILADTEKEDRKFRRKFQRLRIRGAKSAR